MNPKATAARHRFQYHFWGILLIKMIRRNNLTVGNKKCFYFLNVLVRLNFLFHMSTKHMAKF